jgi:zinc transporter
MSAIVGEASAFLWGYAFREGEVSAVTDQTLDAWLNDREAWVWLHFPLSDQRARGYIEALEDLPPAARQLILEVEPRVQVQFAGAWAYGVLPDLERDLEGHATGAGRLQFALDGRLLVTARRHALRVVDEVRRECGRGTSLSGPAAAVTRLIERYVDVAEAGMHAVSEALDTIEDRMMSYEAAELEGVALGPLRREVSRNHREFLALRSALHRAMAPREPHRVPALSDQLPRLAQEAEDLDRESVSLQERARLLNEEIDTRINGATNRSMRALTIISTMLIPPTLIVGAFGMNVPGIPFGTSHAGFIAASILCLVVVVGAWWLLRRMRILL